MRTLSLCRAVLFVAAAGLGCSSAWADDKARYVDRPDIPAWWQNTRAFYCPLANSGAGSSLMKYRTERADGFESFRDLDKMLDDAERLGTNVIYLVDYWEPDYEDKSDYRPKLRWGGDEAFREGIEKVHRRGGRVILYLEALIITRDTELGRTMGPAWAMMDEKGNYYPYYGRDRFYLMYPGPGSGWVEYIAGAAGRLAWDFKIDGVHLDSYGVHLDHVLKDYNPKHPQGKDLEAFHRGAVELVKRVRAELRKHVPEAVVILEGCERTDLLEVCDGAQFESLPKLKAKPWYHSRRYPVFTSSFELDEMQAILDEGHNLALSPWWFQVPGRRDRKELLEEKTDKNNRFDQIMALHRYHNALQANGLLPKPTAKFGVLFEGIIKQLDSRGWNSAFDCAPLRVQARRYITQYERHEKVLQRLPADAIRDMLTRVAASQPAN